MQKKSLEQILDWIHQEPALNDHVEYWHTIEEKPAKTMPFPSSLDPSITQALTRRGIPSLYTHQHEAFIKSGMEKQHTVSVTPTASGKTLSYNLPVLQSIMENDQTRALYLFPTKALAQDQKSEINELIEEMGVNIKSYTYDGDTAPNIRQVIRKAGHVVMTNPDMLHAAILPHHTKWISLFENLQYIIIDELHTYRGVFGSHVANVLRRLKRIAHYYGSSPVFICTSATIANPKELAETLTGEPFHLIDNNGAPQGKKHFVFYNPPIVNEALNIRKSATAEVNKVASLFLKENIQTIVFAKSRVRVEIILSHLQELVKKQLGPKSIRGYRGGYLPKQRREIERGLRDGEVMGVVSTNALELGVDIGQLQVCVMTGYPGSVASTWQQAGRAGRRQDESLTLLVASSAPVDQYMIQHPEFFLEQSPETARIHPDNLIILVDHIKCAAFELPFRVGETFDGVETADILDYLAEEQVLHRHGRKWYWMNDGFPAHGISLRSASQENVIIVDQTDVANVKVIGEMDRFSAMTLLHEKAIYLHQGIQYQVEELDWDERKAYVQEVQVEYYTDANLAVELKVLEEDNTSYYPSFETGFGDVMVNAKATIFKKIKLTTFENIGSGPIHLPEEELHTNACWASFPEETVHSFGKDQLEQALIGAANVLRHVAPVLVLCDQSDLHVVPQMKAAHSEQPTIFLYDRYPGGVGLSSAVYKRFLTLLQNAKNLVQTCPCTHGCPSCVGSDVNGSEEAKSATLQLLNILEEEHSIER
ncbi:DEAD/DEAH box helicase domain-containing protein [Alteribacillus persepolensis]|uniref:DEAD/DEAH box helicase domain-containing protein n=1 Tax=Alteribacillus persepolensis TaxID=568899 RepID=A0A1G7Z050_9BACI|nr:DEAD/DEAH box helicase [Alteribacillus persepolensis]SDH02148.1 DEAD/DEAH box helicase domain-containing protein [Alteribacillus persepolensis]